MFKVGDKVVKKDGSEWDLWKYRIVRVADEYGYIMLYGDSKIYCEEELKLYQEEYNMDFKVGDKVKIINGRNFSNGERVCTINKIDYNNNGVKRAWFKETGSCLHCEYLKKVEEDNMEKTFREVIADIKEGEVWESCRKTISCSENGNIIISIKDGEEYNSYHFTKDTTFKLKRKEYSFEEAFKAYEEGKEIESIYGYRYKNINESDHMYSKDFNTFVESLDGIYIKEIRGKWYIND